MNIPFRAVRRTAMLLGLAGACAGLVLAATPKQQRAVVMTAVGGPEVLQVQTIPVLEPGSGQVLLRVYAAAVNPVDWKIRVGKGPPGTSGGGRVLGMDAAGVVEKVGADVTSVKVGDKVFALIGRTRGPAGLNGAYAQYMIASAPYVIAKPQNLSYLEASGLGVAGLTGLRTVVETKVHQGQRVLITGVAGGVGSAAAQIAKARGAYVIGTASARHAAYLKSIGVDEVVDYTKGKFEEKVKNVDVVIDTVGGDTTARSLETLKKGGSMMTVVHGPKPAKCASPDVTCVDDGPPASPQKEGDMLREVARLAGAGQYKVIIEKTYPLEKAAEAQAYNEQGHTEGKIVLAVDPGAAKRR